MPNKDGFGPNFATALAAPKDTTFFKSGQNIPKNKADKSDSK
jgi:hypothetical protein